MNEFESAAMWKLHLKSDEGVAIQSTYKRLADSFKETVPEVWIGVVNYIDYEVQRIPTENALYPFIYKRKSFEHERELRAVIWDDTNQTNGLQVRINAEELVENVFVSPTAQNWFEELVKSVMMKYGFSKNVIKSSLAKDPLF
jgi:hypothetical protein